MMQPATNVDLSNERATEPALPVLYARLPAIERMFGFNRARAYELLGLGLIRAIKDGRALLVEVASVEAYVATLPTAAIRVGHAKSTRQAA